jgi:hypothetical protein
MIEREFRSATVIEWHTLSLGLLGLKDGPTAVGLRLSANRWCERPYVLLSGRCALFGFFETTKCATHSAAIHKPRG